jgi:hypothetical protein
MYHSAREEKIQGASNEFSPYGISYSLIIVSLDISKTDKYDTRSTIDDYSRH